MAGPPDDALATADWTEMIVIGTIARSHGLRGDVLVQAETDFPEERFQPGSTMYLGADDVGGGPRRLTVRDARLHLGRWLVSFEGVDRIEDAEALCHRELRIAPDRLMPLPAGRFYHHQLVDCEVVTVEGDSVGTVVKVEDAGAATLVVRGGRGDVLVPLAAEICVRVDVDGRRIVIAPPQGLLDLNA
jgi:16S rRNA processing protein RimM